MTAAAVANLFFVAAIATPVMSRDQSPMHVIAWPLCCLPHDPGGFCVYGTVHHLATNTPHFQDHEAACRIETSAHSNLPVLRTTAAKGGICSWVSTSLLQQVPLHYLVGHPRPA